MDRSTSAGLVDRWPARLPALSNAVDPGDIWDFRPWEGTWDDRQLRLDPPGR